MTKAYYNEFDSFAAQWTRELISAGLIPPGDVDERSIVDVQPEDLRGYTQCHFFSGIAGWAAALRLAGIGDDFPVWTGSCPCQPYSSAGKRKGDADERNLWPAFFRLIRECKPELVFGEQVEAAIRHGWHDGISADLEGEGYACGATVLGAHSVGAPHIRQRLYWGAARLADADGRFARNGELQPSGEYGQQPEDGVPRVGLGDSYGTRKGSQRSIPAGTGTESTGSTIGLADTCSTTSERNTGRLPAKEEGVGSTRCINGDCAVGLADGCSDGERLGNTDNAGPQRRQRMPERPSELSAGAASLDCWGDTIAIACRDGKTRRIPTEPALFPLADGIPNRVGLLRGAGNAIVPEAAAEFIKAFLESLREF